MHFPNRGGKNNDGQMPINGGHGIGWGVPRISSNGTIILPGEFPYGGFSELLEDFICYQPQESTTTTTAPSKPTVKPPKRPDPHQNKAKCYKRGKKMTNLRLQYGAESFCSNLRSEAGIRARDVEGRTTGGFRAALREKL
ncbi:hypothetical protein CGRA01v4_04504 [Colletotrichum graminicola]|nr:hypothetical protein CGRA01v4_04504 [Colletotrichum graminicola]